MDRDLLQHKTLVAAAIELYLDDPGQLTVPAIAETASVTPDVVYRYVDSSLFILPAFYDLCIPQYQAIRHAIEGYETFSLAERLATFIFVLFDLLEEQRAFVERTFEPYIIEQRMPSSFRDDVAASFAEILDTDAIPPTNRLATDWPPLHQALAHAYLRLVRFWLNDPSPQQKQTVALVDKLVAFFEELALFRGIERGVDLLKYLVNIGLIDLDRLPFTRRWFDEPQERESGIGGRV
ncbi:MAG: hypothetical protein D6685_03165 [Bacteroidetes bacterium]|nr:MAG: hypothetical protein D6685_03165 [Bacteroidota bacterium]